MRARPSPRRRIITNFRGEFTRSAVAEYLGITYWSARYWLEKLTQEGILEKHVTPFGARGRRVTYTQREVRKIYYRSQYAVMFYTEEPRTKTPDPIAEFRVTGVSETKGRYDRDELMNDCIYIGVVLAPQTFWIKQKVLVTAREIDEEVDQDELAFSVPVFKLLDYCERYAIFFRSRRGDMWRAIHVDWWMRELPELPAVRRGDYEYDEKRIKEEEEYRIEKGVLRKRFNNTEGRMENVI